jgi:tellurite methyltransferase
MRFISIFLLFIATNVLAKQPISVDRLNKLSGEKTTSYDTKSEWDQKYNRPSFLFGKTPAKFLAENFDYIPEGSSILDMGMGEGRNAVFLAQKGHKVTGVDISSVAIKKSYLLAKEFNVKIKGVVASLESYKIPPGSFDAVICFYYVDRKLTKKMIDWLRPGGILIYEAFTIKERAKKGHRKDPESYYLKEQELLTMFDEMRVLKYEEPLHESKYRASIILQKK